MSRLERIELEPAFVLHARPYRDSSLLVETFSRDHGRLGLIARGARSPRSRMRGLLQPFVPLLLSWRGRGELGTLIGAEAAGNSVPLSGSATIIGFYLNELLHRFVHRHDPEPALFVHYGATLERIARESDPEPALRIFEKRLLETVGYALELEREAGSDTAIDPGARYQYSMDAGPKRTTSDSLPGLCVSGSTLLALAREQLADPRTLKEAKHLMRSIIDEHCGGRSLASRKLWRRKWTSVPSGRGATRSPFGERDQSSTVSTPDSTETGRCRGTSPVSFGFGSKGETAPESGRS